MPPKRSPPSTRAMTSSTPTASKGVEGVYQALTAKENQPVVRSIAIFGVSLISIVFFLFFLWNMYGCRSGEAVNEWKLLFGGKKIDGGMRWQNYLKMGGKGDEAGGKKELRVFIFEEGKADWGIALPVLLPKTSTFHRRKFLCAGLVFEPNS